MKDIHSVLEEKRAQIQNLHRDIDILTAALALLNQEDDAGRNTSSSDSSVLKRSLSVSPGVSSMSPKPEKDKVMSQFP